MHVEWSWRDGVVAVLGSDGVRALPDSGLPADWTTAPLLTVTVVGSILALGVGLRWRYGPILDRSVDATLERPLTSLAYGIATHAAVAFAAVYLTARLRDVAFGGVWFGVLGPLVGVLMVLVTATVGFMVLGTILVGAVAESDTRTGLFVGALLGGVLTLLDPLSGAAAWLVLVSAGIGGFSRRWLTASAVPPGDRRAT